MKELSVLYRDEQVVAVNKPPGLLVHRSDVDRRETENAMKALRDQLGRWIYPVHRLDKATSGVLVFALDKETARFSLVLATPGAVREEDHGREGARADRGFPGLPGDGRPGQQRLPDAAVRGGQGAGWRRV
ncbi:MAG TPA: pseudouridine synthase [Candidatus Deferrimicrobiaceae bacterium]